MSVIYKTLEIRIFLLNVYTSCTKLVQLESLPMQVNRNLAEGPKMLAEGMENCFNPKFDLKKNARQRTPKNQNLFWPKNPARVQNKKLLVTKSRSR